MNKGFSVVKIIIILLIIAVLGVGGYFAYNNYFTQMLNPNAGFIPEDLKDYAKGEDADMFIIINDEGQQLNNLLKNTKLPEEYNFDLKSGIIISDSSEKCGLSAIKFNTIEAANNAKKLIEENLINEADAFVKTNLEQKDTLLIIEANEGLTCLSGNLLDNNIFKSLNPEYIDNQLIVALDNQELLELLMIFGGGINTVLMGRPNPGLIEANIPTAHAQLINPGDTPDSIASVPEASPRDNLSMILPALSGLVLAAENTVLYSKVQDSDMNLTLKIKLLDKSDLEKSKLFTEMSGFESDEFYEKLDQMFNEEIYEQMNIIEEEYENIKTTSEYKDLMITLTAEFDVNKLIDDAVSATTDAESRGRDAARMGNLNNFRTSLYAYQADYGTFPEESGCFDESFGDLGEDYFPEGRVPEDPIGEQDFGDLICENGYYYQYLDNDNYALWAKMENEGNNNTNLRPKNLEKLVSEGGIPELSEGGSYYLVKEIALPIIEEKVDKVPRKPKTETSI
jgi:hypothetical protein